MCIYSIFEMDQIQVLYFYIPQGIKNFNGSFEVFEFS